MSSRLSVIFYIILCFEIGLLLVCLPWIPQGLFGLSDWSNNYFLVLATRKTGFYGLQSFVASGWVRGAVSGVGILNIGMAIWETIHFRERVHALQEINAATKVAAPHDSPYPKADPRSDYPRRHDGGNQPRQ
jgi:hypothetical protein